jgi:diguanylate cyclase (GGDEF)-like protein
MLKQFANAYIKEQERLNHYSKELQAANERLEWMANRDGLTSVYNRRAFDVRLSEILEKELRLINDIWIILFDVDFFKTINDTYGHNSGDQVLCALANQAKQILPETSFISRWGGDEFSIIFLGNLSELKSNINEFYQTVNAIDIDMQMTITLSAGITKLEENDTVLSVLKRTDVALYQSKNEGRNRYTII